MNTVKEKCRLFWVLGTLLAPSAWAQEASPTPMRQLEELLGRDERRVPRRAGPGPQAFSLPPGPDEAAGRRFRAFLPAGTLLHPLTGEAARKLPRGLTVEILSYSIAADYQYVVGVAGSGQGPRYAVATESLRDLDKVTDLTARPSSLTAQTRPASGEGEGEADGRFLTESLGLGLQAHAAYEIFNTQYLAALSPENKTPTAGALGGHLTAQLKWSFALELGWDTAFYQGRVDFDSAAASKRQIQRLWSGPYLAGHLLDLRRFQLFGRLGVFPYLLHRVNDTAGDESLSFSGHVIQAGLTASFGHASSGVTLLQFFVRRHQNAFKLESNEGVATRYQFPSKQNVDYSAGISLGHEVSFWR